MKYVQLLEQRELTNHSAQQAKAKCGAARKRGANHLLCAAARRKRPERRPETSGDNQKLGKRPYFGLPKTTEHPGKIVYLTESSIRYL